MIFMTPHKPSNRRSKVDVSRILPQHFPKLGPNLTDGTPYTTNLQVFLRPWLGSMNIIRIKNSRVSEIKKCPRHVKGGGGGGAAAPPLSIPPPLVRLVGEARRNLTKFLSRPSKSSLGPLKPFWSFFFGLTRSPTSA